MKSSLARFIEIFATVHVIQGDVEQHFDEVHDVQAAISELGYQVSLDIAIAVWTHHAHSLRVGWWNVAIVAKNRPWLA